MRRALTAMTCLLVGVGVAVAQDYTQMTWYTAPVRQEFVASSPLHCLAVSPTGNQLAMATDNGISLHYLDDKGLVGDVVKHISMGYVRRVAFSPDGNYLVCGRAGLVIYRRGTWERTDVALPDFSNVSGLVTISQRTEVYAQNSHGAAFDVVNFVTGQQTVRFAWPDDGVWYSHAVATSPDAERVFCLWKRPDGQTLVSGFSNAPGAVQCIWNVNTVPAQAMCVGPGPDYLMVATTGEPGFLTVIRGSDGEVVDHYDVPVGAAPSWMENSRDGRFVVISSPSTRKLTVLSGADIRGLIDPNFNIAEADVRSHTVDLPMCPHGLVLHPTLNVAYCWSETDSRLVAVRIGLPGV